MAGISRNVVVLGLVSFFTDVSSEMIVPVRILFLVIILRTPLPVAGLIEGKANDTGKHDREIEAEQAANCFRGHIAHAGQVKG